MLENVVECIEKWFTGLCSLLYLNIIHIRFDVTLAIAFWIFL